MTTRKTTVQEKKALEYLNDLREGGTVNMFATTGMIQIKFSVEKHEARRLLGLWMKNFNDVGAYEDVIKEH